DNVDPVCVAAPQVAVKAFLQGSYDDATGLMSDQLRVLGLIPTTSPYVGTGEKTTQEVFSVTGPNAIVDWIVLELRSAQDPTQVLKSRSALLQRDGDIVDIDGVSPVSLIGVNASGYFLAVRHRNHLAMMTGSAVLLD
ncbi:MAG: hypothetical protein AAF840_16490, partial [Bacteroidota bacterium]